MHSQKLACRSGNNNSWITLNSVCCMPVLPWLQPQVRCCAGNERAQMCSQGMEAFEIWHQRLIFSTVPRFELTNPPTETFSV